LKNYRLIIQYDGTNYSGWQIQENSVTVQQKITGAIEIILKEKVNLIGSGRTDAGVHALGQTANFRIEKIIDIPKFQYSLNSVLPSDISVVNMEEAHENFHARFDAVRRTYFYLISHDKSPFLQKYSLYYSSGLDINNLNRISNLFLGKHDFTSFSRKSSENDNKVCNIRQASWKQTRGLVVFLIEADRFLHGMVRTIVGTLLKACKNNFDEEYINRIFSSKERGAAAEAAPAKGLFLYKVRY
jgi:tRNA pseudouridine38-40 synthase